MYILTNTNACIIKHYVNYLDSIFHFNLFANAIDNKVEPVQNDLYVMKYMYTWGTLRKSET